jgi:crossover junction endodeoxyribonuclease RuvC
MPNLVIGIDPGLSGALCLLDQSGLREVVDMPVMVKGKARGAVLNEINPAALASTLREWAHGSADDVLIVVESVNSRPTAGPPQPCPVCKRDRKALGSSSVFSMGDTIGAIRGTLAALGYPVQWVTPQRWKKHYGLPGGKEKKELARAHAIKLYPGADLARKRDHNRAEAILLSRFAWDVLR